MGRVNRLLGRIEISEPTSGDTLLHRAVASRDVHLVEYLKDFGARDRVKNVSGKTPRGSSQ